MSETYSAPHKLLCHISAEEFGSSIGLDFVDPDSDTRAAVEWPPLLLGMARRGGRTPRFRCHKQTPSVSAMVFRSQRILAEKAGEGHCHRSGVSASHANYVRFALSVAIPREMD